MREFFARTPDGDDTPVDIAQVRADDALIEALRQAPLFDDPSDAPTRRLWSESTGPDGGARSAVPLELHTEADFADFLRPADGADDLRDADDAASDARVAALLRAWRDEIDAVPLPPPLDARIAMSIIRSAPARRSVRPMIAVAAAIAGLLMGSTAIGARSASPDDTLLWPVTQLLWGDRVEEVEASKEARDGIDEAAKAIDAGHPDAAEAALDHVTVVITKVEDSSEKSTLMSDLTRVQSQLESSRATPSSNPPVSTTPSAPGVPTTVSTNPPTPTLGSSASELPSVTESAPGTSEVVVPPITPPEVPVTTDAPPAETTPADGTSTEPTPETTPTEEPTETPTTPDEVIVPTGALPDEEPGGGEGGGDVGEAAGQQSEGITTTVG